MSLSEIKLLDSIENELKNSKNLLAFSAGVDSSALFFLLLRENIPFDIALVNYGLRDTSTVEERHAIDLAKEYNLTCYRTKAPYFKKNFEKNARDFRYNFFDSIIKKHSYKNLLTAHQLNDQLEWFLMRLTKGAGVNELIGLESISQRKNYTILRPLLHISKEELLDYLKENNYPYFVDNSNFNPKYERNIFRKEFSNRLLSQYQEGIKRSFQYLQEDKRNLMIGYRELFSHKEFYIIYYSREYQKSRIVDLYIKRLGYLLSSHQRKEIERLSSIVIGDNWVVESIENRIFIAPYIKIKMPKTFKEKCRVAKIPSKIRPYLYQEEINPSTLIKLNP